MEDGLEQMASSYLNARLQSENKEKKIINICNKDNDKEKCIATEGKEMAIAFSKKNNCKVEFYVKEQDGSYKFFVEYNE
jgi:hypothetical protein